MKLNDYVNEANEQLKKAAAFAKERHTGQTRKFDGKPYFIHPVRVARIVKQFKGKSKNIDDLMTAAFLHDTVEDTPTTLMEIKSKFGNLVASLVKELTSDADKIKKLGKTDYLSNKMTEELTDYALVLKLADRLDNVSDFPKATASFVEKYKKETNSILKKLEERELTSTQKKLVAAIKEKLK